jgi:hypothetical protein
MWGSAEIWIFIDIHGKIVVKSYLMKKTFCFLSIIVLVMAMPFTSCKEPETKDDPTKYPGGLAWPAELVPSLTYTPEINFRGWTGDFRIGNNNVPMLSLSRIVDNNGDKSTMKVMAVGAQADYDLVEVKGKEIKVRCTARIQGGAPPVNGEIYTLCTDYTLSGSGSGAILTFTGGNVPIVSEEIWTLRK